MAGDLLRLCVRCDEAAPRVVRDAMAQLAEFGGVRDDAILVASELVTNAVRHSLCGPDDLLEISVAGDGRFRISVLDPGVSGSRAQIADRPTGFGGLGLKVVEQLAERWGSERGSLGYRVWAELPTAR